MLSVHRPEAGAGLPVFLLDVQDHDGVRPVQEVRNDHADAFAGPRRRVEHHMLGAAEHQVPRAFAAEDDSLLGAQVLAGDFSLGRPARRAMQRSPDPQCGEDGDGKDEESRS